MNTLSYYRANEEEILIGKSYYFGQLWDGEGDGTEILESGAIDVCDIVVAFKVIDLEEESIMDTLCLVTDMY